MVAWVDFLYEVRWEEAHPICKISFVNFYSELKSRVLSPLEGNNKDVYRNETHCGLSASNILKTLNLRKIIRRWVVTSEIMLLRS